MVFFIAYRSLAIFFFFFFNDTATTEIYTLSLHDALPIFKARVPNPERQLQAGMFIEARLATDIRPNADRKSTRLNSSHGYISYAVFCLKKKKKKNTTNHVQQLSSSNNE